MNFTNMNDAPKLKMEFMYLILYSNITSQYYHRIEVGIIMCSTELICYVYVNLNKLTELYFVCSKQSFEKNIT